MRPPRKASHDESLESYLDRWPEALSHVPRAIIEDWLFRHNDIVADVINFPYKLEDWDFSLEHFEVRDLLSIRLYDSDLEWIDEVGRRAINDSDFRHFA